MNRKDIEQQTLNFIQSHLTTVPLPTSFDRTRSLVEQGILDSFAIVELVVFLESQFDIQVGPDELTVANLGSLEKIAAFVERKASSTAGAP